MHQQTMGPEQDILTDLRHLLSEHGVKARWNNLDLLVLASRVERDQQIDIGGFVDSPDMSARVPRTAFPSTMPKTGDRFEVDGECYRITRVSGHPRSPLLTLVLSSTDE